MKFQDNYNTVSLLLIAYLLSNLCGCQQASTTEQQSNPANSGTDTRLMTDFPRKFSPVGQTRSLQPSLSDAVIASGIFEEYPVPTQHAQPLVGTSDLEPQGPEFFETQQEVDSPASNAAVESKSILNEPQVDLATEKGVTPSLQSKQIPAPNRELVLEGQLSTYAIEAIRGRAQSLTDHGFSLAQRGAFFSARAEFIQALRLLTQTLDTEHQTHRFGQALANGLLA
ncbi:MAG: hypothetical protein COA78_12480, partial [Blastopirellula sp.]